MRNVITAALLLSLTGCSDWVNENYPTYADAERAGAIERGWVPEFVPSSARDIAGSHNLDTNRQTLQFTIPPTDVGEMVAELRPVSAKDESAAAATSKEHNLGAASEAYVVCSKPSNICSEPVNGALAVDRVSGRAVYDTTVEWVDDHCS